MPCRPVRLAPRCVSVPTDTPTFFSSFLPCVFSFLPQIDLRYQNKEQGDVAVVVAPVLRFMDVGYNAVSTGGALASVPQQQQQQQQQ